ncbi:hemerythrin domain-containing protein [Aneurinibacillus tyrosinisolvens]|uniref:hemerythrin domain-containing protein n=1 Tax=Aneurinibacillus tyrosinisolvens TaxID=1443435 RepID=UPI00063F1EBB|nr:hemerythrin domain-containing protein [Aneurinibacillus tyrosinisolvens]
MDNYIALCPNCFKRPDLPEAYSPLLESHEKIKIQMYDLSGILADIENGERNKFDNFMVPFHRFMHLCEEHMKKEEKSIHPLLIKAFHNNEELAAYFKGEHTQIRENMAYVAFMLSALVSRQTVNEQLVHKFLEAAWLLIDTIHEHWYKEEFGLLPILNRLLDREDKLLLHGAFSAC